MLHIHNNIKIIRKVRNETQPEFAKNFTGVTLAMQKSYEGGKADPGVLYCQELSDLSGIPIEKLMFNNIAADGWVKRYKTMSEKEEKVENEEIISEEDTSYLSELLTSYKDRIQEQKEMNDKLTGVININLNTIVQDTRVSLAYQKAWVDYVAEKDSDGNESKKEAIVIKMGKLIASKLQMPRQTDIREGGDRTDKRAP